MLTILTGSEAEKRWPLNELLLEHKEQLWHELGIGQLATCGDEVSIPNTALIGHGIATADVQDTSAMEEGEEPVFERKAYATVTGIVTQVNQLHYVEGIHSRYIPEPGDVVVGRVVEVGQGRWYLDIGADSLATLQLTAIYLPSGEQRRKTEKEAVDMRQFFVEDDLVSTEVQKVNMDGTVMLHTRSARYGKLANGCCVCIPPTLAMRLPQHMVQLRNGVHVVIGRNGFLFLSSNPLIGAQDTLNFVDQSHPRYAPVTPEIRRKIALVRNAVVWLARNFVQVSPPLIEAVFAAVERNGGSFNDLWRVILTQS